MLDIAASIAESSSPSRRLARSAAATSPTGIADAVGRLTSLAATGHLRPIIGQTYPLEQGADALRDIAERRATGKVILEL